MKNYCLIGSFINQQGSKGSALLFQLFVRMDNSYSYLDDPGNYGIFDCKIDCKASKQ